MPPKIKTQTNISPEFIDAILTMYSEWLTLNKRIITKGRGEIAQRLGMTAKRLLPIVRRQSPDLRVGFQYELTRLRRMPFSEFYVVMDVDPNNEYPEIPWLVGRTRHITARDYRAPHPILGELGCYDVCIPSNAMRHPDLSHIHLIPLRNPNAENRHYHHAGYPGTGPTPRSLHTGNCWGSYSGVIKGLMDDPDIPELFRQLHNHLCTYGDQPPYRRLDFDTTTKE
jgi:hypothetical protein